MELESKLVKQMRTDNIITKFSIISEETGVTRGRAKYGFSELRKLNGVIYQLFDHVSEYNYHDKDKGDIGSLLVTNPYLDIELIIDYISKNILFISHCIKHKYDINIYKDTDINIYPGTTMIVFKCSDVKLHDNCRYHPLDGINIKIYHGQKSLLYDKPEVLNIGTAINHSIDDGGGFNMMIDEEKRENFENFIKEYGAVGNADIKGKNIFTPFNKYNFRFGVALEYLSFNSTRFFNTKDKKQLMVVTSYRELADIIQTFCYDYRFITYCIENGIAIDIHHMNNKVNYTDGYMIVFKSVSKPKYGRALSNLYGLFTIQYFDEDNDMKVIHIKPSFSID